MLQHLTLITGGIRHDGHVWQARATVDGIVLTVALFVVGFGPADRERGAAEHRQEAALHRQGLPWVVNA